MDIELVGINKEFEDVTVIENMNAVFKENKATFVMGPSGIGKSTLIKILLSLTEPDSGEVRGMEKMKVSAVFQEDSLCENLSVYLNLKIVKDSLTIEESEKYLEEVGLENVSEKRVRELSGGMKRRVAILRAIIADFDVLIMDEPFKGLDTDTKNRVMDFVIDSIKEKTAIIVTHDSGEYSYFSERTDVEVLNMKD